MSPFPVPQWPRYRHASLMSSVLRRSTFILRSGAGMLSLRFRSLSITRKKLLLTLISMPHHVVNYCTTSSKVCIPSGVSAKIEMLSMQPIIFAFYYQARLRGPMSLLSVFNSVQVWQLQCTFLQKHFLIKFKSPKFFLMACIYFSFFACQLFLVFGYAGVGDSSFLMKGTFSFLTGQFWYSQSHMEWQFRVAKAQSSKLKAQSSKLRFCTGSPSECRT